MEKATDPCEFILELNLVNYIISPGKGLACVLGKRKNLEKIHLDMCVGVRDWDTIGLAKNTSNLRAISLRVPSDFSLPLLMNSSLRLNRWESWLRTVQCLNLSGPLSDYTKWNPQFNSDVLNSGTRFRPCVFLQWRWDGSSLFSSKSWNPRACQMSRN